MTNMQRHPGAEDMTWRARAYLIIGATRHTLIGLSCLFLSNTFQSPAFMQIKAVWPIPVWGALFLIGGLHMAYAAFTAQEGTARVSMTISAVITSVWAAGFISVFSTTGPISPIAGILFTALTLTDLVVCRQPMRSPFEPIVRRYMEPPKPLFKAG